MLIFSVFQISFTQEETEPSPPFLKINTNFQVGVPVHEFYEKLNDVAVGAGFEVIGKLRKIPVWAGVQSGYSLFDRESRKFFDDIEGVENEYEWKTRNNLWLLHGMFRIQPKTNFFIRPYFNGLVGFKRFYTKTNLTDPDVDEGNIESYLDHSDWAFSYGGSFGFEIPLSKNDEAVLDIRCSYFQGVHAQYYVRNENALPSNETLDAFELKRSSTPLLLPQIGVTFNLSKCDM